MKTIEELLDKIKSGALNISKLSRETGIPATRMYKWRDRGSKITANDAAVLDKWLTEQDKSIEVQPEAHRDGLTDQTVMVMLQELLAAQSTQANSLRDISEANLIWARNTERLIARLTSTGGVPPETLLSLERRFSEVLELIAEVGSGKRWKDKAAALAELNKFVISH